ncbi:unnamed protein product [Linum trigynum]|uniref:PKD domain-containing protein n=1 Tax=Linum trigynum TaxID=586398 RepID=A0AAV2DUF0_9ROSI
MSKFILSSSNQFVQATTDTIYVWDFGGDLNSYFFKPERTTWKVVATVRSTPPPSAGTLQVPNFTGLEIFGTVLSGANLVKLATNLYSLQLFANREGYALVYYNSDGSKDYKAGTGSVWKLNELYDWNYLGVKQVTTWTWDRFSMANAGVLIAYKSEVDQWKKQVSEKDKEIAKLKAAAAGASDESLSADGIVAELRKDIEEQNKQLEEAYKEVDELNKQLKQKKEEVAAKDKEIQALKASSGGAK